MEKSLPSATDAGPKGRLLPATRLPRVIHVNQLRIRRNIRAEVREPPISVRTTATSRDAAEFGDEIIIYGCDGKEAARILYRPDTPLNCGARLWIETVNAVEIRTIRSGAAPTIGQGERPAESTSSS